MVTEAVRNITEGVKFYRPRAVKLTPEVILLWCHGLTILPRKLENTVLMVTKRSAQRSRASLEVTRGEWQRVAERRQCNLACAFRRRHFVATVLLCDVTSWKILIFPMVYEM